jgi:hypothetical protein
MYTEALHKGVQSMTIKKDYRDYEARDKNCFQKKAREEPIGINIQITKKNLLSMINELSDRIATAEQDRLFYRSDCLMKERGNLLTILDTRLDDKEQKHGAVQAKHI